MRIFWVKIVVIVWFVLGAFGVQAQPLQGSELQGPAYLSDSVPSFVSEVRVGVFAHKVTTAFLPFNPGWIGLDRIEDLHLEVLFTSPDHDFVRWIGAPRPNLGVTFGRNGVESLLHLGLTWQLPIFDTPLFIEGTFGAAITNGALSDVVAPLSNFGCPVGFYENASLGINLSDNVTAMITYEHTSNLSICTPNDGLSNLGIRIGYKF